MIFIPWCGLICISHIIIQCSEIIGLDAQEPLQLPRVVSVKLEGFGLDQVNQAKVVDPYISYHHTVLYNIDRNNWS